LSNGDAHPNWLVAPPWNFELRIRCQDAALPATLVGALYVDGSVEGISGDAPCVRAFVASTCICVVAAGAPAQTLEVELWSNRFGAFQKVAGIRGRSGYIIEDHAGPMRSSGAHS